MNELSLNKESESNFTQGNRDYNMANVNEDIHIKDEPLDHTLLLVQDEIDFKPEIIQKFEIKVENIYIKEEPLSLNRERYPEKQQIANSGEKPSNLVNHLRLSK